MRNKNLNQNLRDIEMILPSVRRVGAPSISNLFEYYIEAGFLYPDKMKRIEPHLSLVKKNWELALKADESILWIMNCKGEEIRHYATVSLWRSTENGWLAQHLAAAGPNYKNRQICALSVMLASQLKAIEKGYHSGQNWYSKKNKYASKIFGTIVESIGVKISCVNSFKYLSVVPDMKTLSSRSIKIVQCKNENDYGIFEFLKKMRGKVFSKAEEYDSNDIELLGLDDYYRKVQLRRKRYMWMAFSKKTGAAKGAAIAYRGPFGLNFSFLENRCDLIIDKNLDDDDRLAICYSLINRAKDAYFGKDFTLDYPLDFIPVVTDDLCADLLQYGGASLIREYNQSAWLRKGFIAWLMHTKRFFQEVLDRNNGTLRIKLELI